jgi:hypothetical protein
MTDAPDEKHARLLEAGLIKPDVDVPEAYKAVIDSFTPDELETLVSIRKRLNQAGQLTKFDAGDVFFAP